MLLLSVAAFGLDNNVNWFNCCVEPFLGGIIPAFNVQSVDGFLVRLVTGTSRLSNWDPMTVPMAYKVARQILFAALLGYVAWAMQRAGARHPPGRASETARVRELLEFVLVLNLALVLSPISWSHYYALMLLPWGLYLGGRLPWPSDALARRLLWSGIVLCSLPIVVLPLQAGPDRRDRGPHAGVGHVRGRRGHARSAAAATASARHNATSHRRGRRHAMNIHAVREQAALVSLQPELRRADHQGAAGVDAGTAGLLPRPMHSCSTG